MLLEAVIATLGIVATPSALIPMIAATVVFILALSAPASAQLPIDQDGLKARALARLDSLADLVKQQANKSGAAAERLSAAPVNNAKQVLKDVQKTDPSAASVSSSFAALSAPPALAFAAPAQRPSEDFALEAKSVAVRDFQIRSKHLSDYTDQLRSLRNEIADAPSDQVLSKLQHSSIPPRIAELVFDPIGENLPPGTPGVRQVSRGRIRSENGLVPFIVGPGNATVDFPAVGAVLYKNSQSDLVAWCTGTLITPSVVLTAAHCLNLEDPAHKVHRPFGVFFQQAGYHTLSTTTSPKQYYGYKNGSPFGDLAMLFLSDSIDEISPATINTWGRVRAGTVTRIVGYGYHNPLGQPGNPRPDRTKIVEQTGIKLWGHTLTSNCGKQRSLICWTYANTPIDQTFGSTCYGDSGGPLFIQVNGRWLLAGVTRGSISAQVQACKPGDNDIDVEIFDFRQWISTAIAGGSNSDQHARLQPLDALDNPDSRYPVEISDSIFQPSDPSFSKDFTLDPSLSLIRVTLNATPRKVGISTGLRLEVGVQGSPPTCIRAGTDTYVICELTSAAIGPGGNWIVKAFGAGGQEFQVVATIFDGGH